MINWRRLAILLASFVFIGCNGAVQIEAPEMKAVTMGVSDITVYWEPDSAIESRADFAGYNVYVHTDSAALLVDDGEDLNKFNTQVVTDTFFQANGLSQDSVYYIQVRTVNTDYRVGGYNAAVPFLAGSPRPEFVVTLRLSSGGPAAIDSCAVRYVDGMIMADSLMADSMADMWVKAALDTVWVVSPAEHALYGNGARSTLFANIGPVDFEAFSTVLDEPGAGDTEVAVGEVVAAKTEDGNYVKLRVEAIDTVNNTMTVLYGYQNIAGFPYF